MTRYITMNTFPAVLSAILFFIALSLSALTMLGILADYREGVPSETVERSTRFMVVFCCIVWSLFYLNFLFLP